MSSKPSRSLSSVFPSIRVFPSESALHSRWPKYRSFSFSISSSNEYLGLTSFRIDWFDLAVQGTLKSLLQHHSSKASIFWWSAFSMGTRQIPCISCNSLWEYIHTASFLTLGKTIRIVKSVREGSNPGKFSSRVAGRQASMRGKHR